jgi:alkanesulfonate monooxygenase SsuD/methylene tetrahydromethanopterin reductase-like flavin-dependent oxidoreductase (luciferase family)
MKLGLFLDLRNPAAWRRSWADHYTRTIERVVEAERLGIDAVWLSEHHLFDDGYLPQPLTLAAALAARTRQIRIGTAVVIAPLRHPLHLAEEAALVDVISAGRLELGLGAGWAEAEFEAFGADHTTRHSATDSMVREVRRLLDGVVTPPPIQAPVPLWLGYQGPRGAHRAGRLGVGLLSLDRRRLEPYQAGLAEGGWPLASARMGGVVDVLLSDDPERDRARVAAHRAHQAGTYASGLGPLPVLTPAEAARHITERVDGLPVEHVYLWLSIGGMDDELVDRQLELAAIELAPALAREGA